MSPIARPSPTRARMGWAVMAVMLAISPRARAETTVITPQAETDNCESSDCLQLDPKPAPRSGPRTIPPRSWQMKDRGLEPRSSKPARYRRRGRGGWWPRKPEAETEFQQLVYRSTGSHLAIFGHQFFSAGAKQPFYGDRTPVPADYTLSTGDELLIHMWGQMDFNSIAVVDRNGQIFLPRLGMITVTGVPYSQLQSYLKTSLGRYLRNFELSVSMGQMRKITVVVAGRARYPGRYAVSSLSTVANVLSYAGGPAANGSMRQIALKRQGRTVAEFDAYDLLLHGDNSKDQGLLAGDIVYVPPVGPLVAVAGSVNQPAIYELRGATPVGQQLDDAGGLTPAADASRATLERLDSRPERKIEDFALDESGRARMLHDGDVLRLFPVSPRFENAVTLRGHVAHPGRYPWRPQMRVQDLIPSREAILPDEYWLQQNALGQAGPGWIESRQLPPDAESHSSAQAASGAGDLSPQAGPGPGEQPGSGQQRRPRPRVGLERNLEINWDYAVVQRLNPADLTSRLLSFNLGRALADANSSDNLVLEAGDVVTIFSRDDLGVPAEKRSKLVWIEGEVKAAGIYRAEPGETLRDLVVRAGGLTGQAYLFAADFRRDSVRREQEQKLQAMVSKMEQEMRSRAAEVAARGNAEERQAGRDEMEAERSLLEKLRQTRPTGRIVLNLKPKDMSALALPELPLEDGDRLTIPPRPSTLQVVGEVYNQSAFIYAPGKTVGDYLGQSGGATHSADTGRMFLIRADGSVLSKQMRHSLWGGRLESVRPLPGDTIVMPERIRTSSLLRGMRDWSQVFAQFALGAAAVRVISP